MPPREQTPPPRPGPWPDDSTDSFAVTAGDGLRRHGRRAGHRRPSLPNEQRAIGRTAGKPNTVTGLVTGTGSLHGDAGRRRPLTYSRPATSWQGRHGHRHRRQARSPTRPLPPLARPPQPRTANDYDTFTVTVKDSRGSSATADVTVEVAPTGSVNQLTLPGLADGVFTADGTHLVRTFSSGTTPATATTQVTVVDVATATQLGQTITLSGYYQVQGFNTNDTRAVLKGTFAYPDDTVGIAVINVESGAQVGETMLLTRPTGDQNNTSTVSLSADRNLELPRRHNLRPQFVRGGGDDHRRVDRHHPARDRPVRVRRRVYGRELGHRAVVATVTYDAAAGVFATQFDVINTLDGTSHDLTIPGLWSTVNLITPPEPVPACSAPSI